MIVNVCGKEVLIKKALIVAPPYAGLLLSGKKTWEMRSRPVLKIRGRIGIIEKGTGHIQGTIELVDCFRDLGIKKLWDNRDKHLLEYISLLGKWPVVWEMKNPIKFDEPVKYKHPQGAVIWVNI